MIVEGMSTRDVLLQVAERLFEEGGLEAVTTRAVCEAGMVKAPTLYHHFRDKNGLLDALVAKGVEAFLARKKASADTNDALADIVSGWEDFMGFALDRPQLFRLIVQRVGDNPRMVDAAMAATDMRLARLADEGRLTTDIALARGAMLALANGVTALWAQGAPRGEVEEVGRFLLGATLGVLVRRP